MKKKTKKDMARGRCIKRLWRAFESSRTMEELNQRYDSILKDLQGGR